MEFRVLGRLEVEANGVDVTPRRPKQRTLLALLLLRAGDVVSADELVEALWEGQPPETAQTALHGHVSALRKQLGRERIETRPPGYVLHLAANDELDVYRLERLVEEARAADPRGREEKLKQALALFHGEPLADFRFEAFARPEADRLDELRAATLEDDVDAELALGRHRDVLPRLERMVAEHPLRERLRAQLMLALYRSGRQADALAAFTEERELLVSELGIEPSPALQRLERQILNQAPELSPPELLAPLEREPAAKPAGIVTLAVVDTTEDAQAAMVASSAARSGGIALDGRPGSSAFAFGRARDAAAFAAAVQGFRRYRIGLDSAEVGAGGSYSTHVVRAAAGVCAAAHEGQILVTAATRTLLREAGVGDADLVEVGEHRLQDLAPPRRLFQLSVLGLEGEFPPVRGLESLATEPAGPADAAARP